MKHENYIGKFFKHIKFPSYIAVECMQDNYAKGVGFWRNSAPSNAMAIGTVSFDITKDEYVEITKEIFIEVGQEIENEVISRFQTALNFNEQF